MGQAPRDGHTVISHLLSPPPFTLQVLIQTVDSFQGKQMDIIIMSCVRATTGGGGIGFVNDVRRLNVAITRAKLALWILGSRATLQVGIGCHGQLAGG